jgi:hypothetical protein
MFASLWSSPARSSFPIFPGGLVDRGDGFGTKSRASPFTTGIACALGCRGFAGPIPPPLWMSVIQLCPKRSLAYQRRKGAGPARPRILAGGRWGP